jgi:hypothetical protein
MKFVCKSCFANASRKLLALMPGELFDLWFAKVRPSEIKELKMATLCSAILQFVFLLPKV